jgi:inorganic phosphate transporter, PiT family
MSTMTWFVFFIIVAALLFDCANGWHDAANSIATVVSTRVLSPGVAVVWAAFFNFVAFIIFGTRVARTIGGDMVNIELIEDRWKLWVLLCGLIGAILWDVITWYFGLPTSSSHALIGAYAGAAIAAHRGVAGLLKAAGWIKTLGFIVISPLLGMALGFTFMVALLWIIRRRSPDRVDKIFRRGQLFSAALYSLGHGGNDAQKTMGIITAVLAASNLVPHAADGGLPAILLWVVLACHAAMALGTLSGGWRIVHTMGSRLTKLKPIGGFAAETAAAVSLFLATFAGIPVSTTHTITGAIVGVGSTRRLSAVRWGVAGRVVWAWILTIPCSAVMAAACFLVVQALARS